MIGKAKNIKSKAVQTVKTGFFSRGDKGLTAADVQVARDYIAAYWPKLERFHPKDDDSL